MAKKAIDRFSIRYTLIKNYVKMTHRLFYRKFQVKFQDRIPKDRAVLLAPNHQNALMDAMAALMTSRRDVVFLTRSDVFNNKIMAGIFRIFKMLPIYRIRDGASELGKNEEIFNESMEVLLRKKSPIGIFPEGNHGDKRRIRPLVKGIFRIAFQAQEKFGEQPGVVIVPAGFDYTVYSNFRSHLFVQYGEPIEVCEYYADYLENPARAINKIRERLSAEMKKYVINIQSTEHYETYMLLRVLYNARMRKRLGFSKKDLYHRLLADQHMIEEVSKVEAEKPEIMSRLSELSTEYRRGLKKIGIRDWVFRRKSHSWLLLILADLGMLAMLPVFIYGTITNLLLYWLGGRFSKRIKDTQFRSTVKFVIGTFGYLIWYLILFILAWIFTSPGWIKWAFLLSLPVTGLLAHTWVIWFKKLKSLWKYQFLTLNRNKNLSRLKELRKDISELADSMIPDPADVY